MADSTDLFLADLDDLMQGATTDADAVSALFGAMERDVHRAINKDRDARQADMQIVDADPAAFPLRPNPTIVRVLRHTVALTGFTPADLDDVFGNAADTTDTLLRGDDVTMYYFGRDFVDFVNISRRVSLTYPGRPVRDWWETRGHGKRLTPLDLARDRRLRDRIFLPYSQEITRQGQVCPQIFPTLGGSSIWVEMGTEIRYA